MDRREAVGTKRRILASEGGAGPYALVCMARGHSFMSDKPEALGGTDGGPDPFELLMGSLAACTAMTLRMYVDRRAIDVGRIRVWVEHEESVSPSVPPTFLRAVSFERPVNDSFLPKLRDIADKCPVHKVIAAGSQVKTRFVESCSPTEVEER